MVLAANPHPNRLQRRTHQGDHWENCALPDTRKFKRHAKRKAPQKTTKVEIDEGAVNVELSSELQERLSEAARRSGQSEADLIREAIAEAISRRTNQKPN